MKAKGDCFTITVENSLVGFETEQVYRICQKDSNVKICNIYEDKSGNFCVGSVCHAQLDILIEALKFAKIKIK